MSAEKKRRRRPEPAAPLADPATSAPPRAAEPPPPAYEEPGARNPERRVEGMSIDPKLEDLDESAGAPTRPRRE
jgi:hypothetical protein